MLVDERSRRRRSLYLVPKFKSFVTICTIESKSKSQRSVRSVRTPEISGDQIADGLAGLANRADDLPISLLADLVNAVTDFVGTVNSTGEFLFLNRAGRRLLEIPQDEDIRGQSVLPYNEIPTFEIQQEMDRVIQARKHEWAGTNVFVTRSGKRIPMSQSVVAHITDGVRCYSTIARDITEQIRAEQELRWAAEHDQLTGLLNRLAFRSSVEKQSHRAAILLVLELENFKQVNDTYGHHVGDQVLQRAAWVLTDTLNDGGVTARLGGDEFAAVVYCDMQETSDVVIEHLRSELHRHLALFGVGVAIGTAILDLANEPLDAALQMADLNLITNKRVSSPASKTAASEHLGPSSRQLRRSLRHPR
jgi:diguanylate cyclase (GGDEF)-like protein/PAS domain S-box-containing protein